MWQVLVKWKHITGGYEMRADQLFPHEQEKICINYAGSGHIENTGAAGWEKGNLGELQMFLGQRFRTEMPERLLPVMFLHWQQPQAVPAGSFELLLLTFYLSGNSSGYKMSSEVEICSAQAEIQGKYCLSTAKCLCWNPFPEEWENKYLKVYLNSSQSRGHYIQGLR